ncbi:MAG: ATP-binding protein [Clostridia bacterium]|nr:ATP-binding protein [Clostridia bacterium]
MYSYENYDKVKAEIEKRRLNAIAEADRRNEELRERSEEIRTIDEELSGTGIRIFRAACGGEDITPIKERSRELMHRRAEIMIGLGYPEDYTKVKYFCPDCSDSGFIGGTKMCHCFREALIKATIASSGIGNLIETQSFDNFDLGWYKNDPETYEKMTNIYKEAKYYVEHFNDRRGNLLFVGPTGVGKTHISTAIAREIINRGYDVIYDSVQNVISDFESDKFRSGYGATDNKSDKYLECDLLIIDDLGTEFTTQFSMSCLYNLINTRQNKGRATIISTNYPLKDLSAKYEDRIFSRLIGKGTQVLVFAGRDKRLFR